MNARQLIMIRAVRKIGNTYGDKDLRFGSARRLQMRNLARKERVSRKLALQTCQQ
jgi:hypothetical protein